MRSFHDLLIWQKAHQLTLAIYKATADFPRDELYGLTSQIRRAASSVPANIAEGCGRDTDADFARFCHSDGFVERIRISSLVVTGFRFYRGAKF
jgi:hypothetical protein